MTKRVRPFKLTLSKSSLVVEKVLDRYAYALELHLQQLARLRKGLELLNSQYMRDMLGEATFKELILLEGPGLDRPIEAGRNPN